MEIAKYYMELKNIFQPPHPPFFEKLNNFSHFSLRNLLSAKSEIATSTLQRSVIFRLIVVGHG